MTLDRTNRWLLGTAIVLLVWTGLQLWLDSRPEAPLFTIPPIQALEVRAIDVQRGDDHLRLERGERWAVSEPRALGADEERVGAFLRDWSTGFTPDLRLLRGDAGLEAWGLDPASRTTLRLEGDDGPLVELYLGAAVAGGGHHVGRPGDDGVYRGRVPGAWRLDLDPEAWRDARLFPFAKDDLAALVLEGPAGRFGFVRTEGPDRATWSDDGRTGFEPSSRVLDAVARSLCDAQATRILEGEEADRARLDADLGRSRVALTTEAGRTWTLQVGAEVGGAVWAAIDGDPRLFQIPIGVARQLDKDRRALRERTVLRIERSEQARITWSQGAHRLVLAPQGEHGWAIVEPPGWDPGTELDLAANSLVNLQAVEVLDGPHPSDASVDIELLDAAGSTSIHLRPDGERWLAWDDARPETFVLRGAVLDRLLRVFGAR